MERRSAADLQFAAAAWADPPAAVAIAADPRWTARRAAGIVETDLVCSAATVAASWAGADTVDRSPRVTAGSVGSVAGSGAALTTAVVVAADLAAAIGQAADARDAAFTALAAGVAAGTGRALATKARGGIALAGGVVSTRTFTGARAAIAFAASLAPASRRARTPTEHAFLVGLARSASAGVLAGAVHAGEARIAFHTRARVLDADAVGARASWSADDVSAAIDRPAFGGAHFALFARQIAARVGHAGSALASQAVVAEDSEAGTGSEAAGDTRALHAGLAFAAHDTFARIGGAHARHLAGLGGTTADIAADVGDAALVDEELVFDACCHGGIELTCVGAGCV